jgi:hypothetical protein
VAHETTSAGPERETLDRILESARECFLRKGVRKTRIVDIAEGAGMVRQTVYDWVASRGRARRPRDGETDPGAGGAGQESHGGSPPVPR